MQTLTIGKLEWLYSNSRNIEFKTNSITGDIDSYYKLIKRMSGQVVDLLMVFFFFMSSSILKNIYIFLLNVYANYTHTHT